VIVPSRMRVSPAGAVLIVVLSGIFWHYTRLPLAHTDLWGHLAYGRWITEHRALPAVEPFMSLARDVPLVDTAWLSQLIGFLVYRAGGIAGLQTLHGAAVALCAGLATWPSGRGSRSMLAPAVALASFLTLEVFQFRIIRPQMAGLACFLTLVALLESPKGCRRAAWFVPLLFAAWANLHGSFVVGIGWIVLTCAGRALDAALKAGTWRAAMVDRRAGRLLALALLASIATLVNPYGVRLYGEVISVSRHPNLRDLIEWTPLDFGTVQGRLAAVAVGLLVVRAAASRFRLTWARWVPLVVFGVTTIGSARGLVWWAPLAATCLALPGARGGRPTWFARNRSRSTAATGVAIVALIGALVGSPLGLPTWSDEKEGDPRRALAPDTPVWAAAYLRAHPPTGLVFHPYEWGDYLLWAGPAGLRVFVTSHAHLISPEVWRRHQAISRGEPEALKFLEEHGVNTVVIDTARQRMLRGRLERDGGWQRVAGDSSAAIYRRATPE
jgi:hypothetical protein